jgi:hypothetical protein
MLAPWIQFWRIRSRKHSVDQIITPNYDAVIAAAFSRGTVFKLHGNLDFLQHTPLFRNQRPEGRAANPAIAREFARGFLHPSHPRYSVKLAAAFAVRQALEDDPTLLACRSPKAAAKKWLVSHALDYELIKANGEVNELGIEEITKIVNWLQMGGATKTPSRKR